MNEQVLTVSDFIAVFNQTLEYAYPSVLIEGELTNFRVSKNKWVYFDLKDEQASVRFFGTVYSLPGPLEDGMMLQVRGAPRLHQLYGFSINIQTIQPVGEGSLKRAAALLEAKLAAEGLFDPMRKRPLSYPPARIGLITSSESAAYHDFMKVLNQRWRGVEVRLADIQVQGELAPAQLVAAIEHLNTHVSNIDTLVITRGGGSAEDLAAFSTEQVTRAVAGSRIPTLVAVGHEIDVSLAELAADMRASTPSNAAELLVPDKREVIRQLNQTKQQLHEIITNRLQSVKEEVRESADTLAQLIRQLLSERQKDVRLREQLLAAYNPHEALRRGYAVARARSTLLRSGKGITTGNEVEIELIDAYLDTEVKKVRLKS